MIQNPQKILAIQFKYLGDAVLLTPALRFIKKKFPNTQLHVLVSQETAVVLENLPFIDRLWSFPRQRGIQQWRATWQIIQQLRKEKFDLSIDFAGNDRGALINLFLSAQNRLALTDKNKLSQLMKRAYTKTLHVQNLSPNWVERYLALICQISNWQMPQDWQLETTANLNKQKEMTISWGVYQVLCHLGTSQAKKEWGIEKWQAFYNLIKHKNLKLLFASGTNEREQTILQQLKMANPEITILPTLDLSDYIAIIANVELVICGDTSILHIAKGLGKKVIALFAVKNSIDHYASIYNDKEKVIGIPCTCNVHTDTCQNPISCMQTIDEKKVLSLVDKRSY